MPFAVDDIRVICHTKNASRVHGRLSGAEWVLSSPVMPPNPNYKIKMHITTMQVPNSFEHVGPRQSNDTIVILRRWSSESYADAVARGDYIKVTISTKDGHIANVRDYFESLGTLEKGINNKIVEVCRFKPGWAQSPFVPQLRIDKRGFPLLYVREVFMGTNDAVENSQFDKDDALEEPVYDGLNSMIDIVPGYRLNVESPWVFFNKARVALQRPTEIIWHNEPFFLFVRKIDTGTILRGFGFVIKGKNILGKTPFGKEAYFIKNDAEPLYQPMFRESGYYPIEEDAHYMVVAMVDGDTSLRPVPEFKGYIRDVPDDRPGALLQAGDLRIFQVPTRPATAIEINEDNMSGTAPELQIVGPTLLCALDPDRNFYAEIDETVEENLQTWFVFGYSGLNPDIDLDQAPHLHAKKNGIDEWNPPGIVNPLFDNGFKVWYYRWGAHLYNSVTSTTVSLANYGTFNSVTGYITREDGKNVQIGTPALVPAVVYPRTQFGITPFMDCEYKIITGFDLNSPEKFGFTEDIPTGLADIVGFTRFVYTAGVNVPNTDLLYLSNPGLVLEPNTNMPRDASRSDESQWIDHVVTQAPCDFSGVRFIKLYTNMNISSIDSDGRDSRLLAIMPTVGTSAMESNYLVGALQGSQTFTLADTKIDRIRFDLTDDNNIPIEMYRDWWVDLTFSFEEPYNMDFYQGIAKIINIGTRYTTEGYKYDDYSTITKDIGDEMDRVVSAESRNRRGNADLGTKRKHGFGGY